MSCKVQHVCAFGPVQTALRNYLMTDSRKIVATQIIRGDVHVQTVKNTRICCPYDGEICGTKQKVQSNGR